MHLPFCLRGAEKRWLYVRGVRASRNLRNELFPHPLLICRGAYIIRSSTCLVNVRERALLDRRHFVALLPSSMLKGERSGPAVDTEKRDAASVSEVADTDFAEINERRLMRKIDFRIVPWLSLLYLLNSLDRSNIGNSRVSAC